MYQSLENKKIKNNYTTLNFINITIISNYIL